MKIITLNRTDKFNKAIKIILANEGGYVNHPNDPGGETNLGITTNTLKQANSYGITDLISVKNLTTEIASDIYYEMYWKPSKAENMLSPIDLIHFDATVNCGGSRANKLLQQAINFILAQKILVVDGIIGKNTLKYFNSVVTDDERAKEFSYILLDERDKFYENLAAKNSKMKVFLKGWHNRTNNLRKLIKKGY